MELQRKGRKVRAEGTGAHMTWQRSQLIETKDG